MRSDLVRRIFAKDYLGVQDYCMTCGHFVANLPGCPADHIIVRRVKWGAERRTMLMRLAPPA